MKLWLSPVLRAMLNHNHSKSNLVAVIVPFPSHLLAKDPTITPPKNIMPQQMNFNLQLQSLFASHLTHCTELSPPLFPFHTFPIMSLLMYFWISLFHEIFVMWRKFLHFCQKLVLWQIFLLFMRKIGRVTKFSAFPAKHQSWFFLQEKRKKIVTWPKLFQEKQKYLIDCL